MADFSLPVSQDVQSKIYLCDRCVCSITGYGHGFWDDLDGGSSMSRIPLPSSPRGRRRPCARPGHSASRHDFRAPCRGRGERGEGSERLNCEPVAEPLLERIRRAERACKQLNTSGLSEPTCFLCEADKWKYERPEVKVRETKVKRERKMAKEGDQDGLYSLMLALSKLCKHQNGDRSGDLWTWLLEPLRSLVPCEEVKFVVRCLGPALPTPTLPFSHDAEVQWLWCSVVSVGRPRKPLHLDFLCDHEHAACIVIACQSLS